MGLLDLFTNQFIEVIEWTDDSSDMMVYRFPVANNEIKMGAQLTVRESQVAIFVNEGKVADVFAPGRYTLTTQNLPVLTLLKSWRYGFDSPFKAEVYFVNTKQFIDQKWGTTNPVIVRDSEFGVVRIRAFGAFTFRVSDALTFLKEIFGTNGVFETDSIIGQLRRSIVSGFSDILGEAKISILDISSSFDELGKITLEKLQTSFNTMGLQLSSFYVENISVPEDVEKAIDKKSSMGIYGDLNKYTKFQTAEAIKDAAQNPGQGGINMGMGLGAGAAFGAIMTESLKREPEEINATQLNVSGMQCPSCGHKIPTDSKFCTECGKSIMPPKAKCLKCNAEIEESMKFCPICGTPQNRETVCGKCGKKVPLGVKFCSECGEKIN
ncbi:SPFH domain-containing protein [Clostridium sp. 'White wine YQ']|uniref:SPFH domain-containing protein n=1 Tax=Clostridium sp. 'White wine YQ' TaxID=3027474 RepID=UPI00236647F1|nr:SPFH domain-containing protein [Clostridium sp. 'White wine YQ']MDD7795347.1 SPFH domain-containing protein [Clostridium sp. 'White wine YQ']